jgi:hypothetical protein
MFAATYIGCFTDNSQRGLPNKVIAFNDGSSGLTWKACYDKAVAQGYTYFALQAGYQCFVGNDYFRAISLGPSTSCNTACTGDGAPNCGKA